MAVRLHLKIGLVPAGDRLASSPDAVLHHEPSIGATSRSKGNLYGIGTGGPGPGLESGPLGAVIAVVRGHELYVATIGDADAYLVRQARLLTLPEEERGAGLPSAAEPRVGVGGEEVGGGDSLGRASRNETRSRPGERLNSTLASTPPSATGGP